MDSFPPTDPLELLPASVKDRILNSLTFSELHSSLSCVCKSWRALVAKHHSSSMHVDLATVAAGSSFARFLEKHSHRCMQISIHGGALIRLQPRTAMWAALASSGSSSSSSRQLQQLNLCMPLNSTDEVALLACLLRQAPHLHTLQLHYCQPSPQLCFESAAAAGALAAATQLRSLRITGAALACSPNSLRRLSQLTCLEVTTAQPGFAGLLSSLLQLQQLSITSARLAQQAGVGSLARDQLDLPLVSSLAQCSGLTSVQLVGFKAGSSNRELLRGLIKLQGLQQLELAGSLLQARQLLPLVACTALTRLCLASSNLGNIEAAAAAAAAGAPGADDDDGSSSGAEVLAQLLPALQQLQELDVSGCRVQLQPAYCLTHLTSLHAGAHRFRFHPNRVTAADLLGISKAAVAPESPGPVLQPAGLQQPAAAVTAGAADIIQFG